MDSTSYIAITRQDGLRRELTAVAQNIANVSTTGYRREGVTFTEHVVALGQGAPSVSMAHAHARHVDSTQGPLRATGGTFDFAIEGQGFFTVQGAEGVELTRAGSFTPNAEGILVAPDGAALLDAGGAPIPVPAGAGDISLAADGTLSANGLPVAQLVLVTPAEAEALTRRAGARFATEAELVPVIDASLKQGFLEGSNVNPVAEIARMIEVQHAYEIGRGFADKEDERIRAVVQTLGR
ncbi:MAG: flagellar hook-basal body complex protein [Paracoccaceae bacterium]